MVVNNESMGAVRDGLRTGVHQKCAISGTRGRPPGDRFYLLLLTGDNLRSLAEQYFLAFFGDRGPTRIGVAPRISPYRCGTLAHSVEPAAKVRKVLEILLLALPGHDPWIRRHIGNRIVLARDEGAAF